MARVLVAEDEQHLRIRISHALIESGHMVAAARNAAEAMELARRHRPIDLVCLNLALPDGNGLRLYEDLLGCHPQTRVLYISSAKNREFDLLRKPFTVEEFLSAVEAALNHPRTAP